MITNVSTTPTTDTTAADSAMKKATGMNKDDFLKLFVTQLQNQDPLNPQDSSQFITQLAQLTQVEQAYNTNTNLQGLLNQGSNGMAMASVSMIGKQVEAPGSQVSLQAGTPAAINFNLAQSASQVTVAIQDATGATVKTISAGAMGAGAGTISWDGSSDAGSKLNPGAYSFSVSAKDANGNAVSSSTSIRGTVTGVDMSGAIPVLTVGNLKLNLTDVTSVYGG
jgi:flagellar basal-body rod modification protein FlgD